VDLTDQNAWGWEMTVSFSQYREDVDPDDWDSE
jgi:hypothetical protein